jgi:hypothetical protein
VLVVVLLSVRPPSVVRSITVLVCVPSLLPFDAPETTFPPPLPLLVSLPVVVLLSLSGPSVVVSSTVLVPPDVLVVL